MCQGAKRVKKARVQTLMSEFKSLCMKDGEQLDDFYLRLNGLVMNIRALWEEIKESYVMKKLLRAVPPKFLQIVSTIEQFGDLDTMSMEEAIGSLKAHEEWMRGKQKRVEDSCCSQKRSGPKGKVLKGNYCWEEKNGLSEIIIKVVLKDQPAKSFVERTVVVGGVTRAE